MRKNGFILFLLIQFAVLFLSTDLCAQNDVSNEHELDGQEYYIGIIESYLDPEFPEKPEDKLSEKNYRLALLAYAESHPAFPSYSNTGNPEADKLAFENAKEDWFINNPFFPEYIDTGNPAQDKERFEKARREWINRYPEDYHRLYEIVTGDDELYKMYSFIIQK